MHLWVCVCVVSYKECRKHKVTTLFNITELNYVHPYIYVAFLINIHRVTQRWTDAVTIKLRFSKWRH